MVSLKIMFFTVFALGISEARVNHGAGWRSKSTTSESVRAKILEYGSDSSDATSDLISDNNELLVAMKDLKIDNKKLPPTIAYQIKDETPIRSHDAWGFETFEDSVLEASDVKQAKVEGRKSASGCLNPFTCQW